MNRRIRLAAALAAGVLALAGCTQTVVGDEYTPADGANGDTQGAAVRNAIVVSDEAKSALSVAVINKTTENEALTGISLVDDSGRQQQLTAGQVNLKPGEGVYFGAPFRGPGDRRFAILLNAPFKPGTYVTMNFSFTNSESIEIDVPVTAPLGEYEAVLANAKPKTVTLPGLPEPEATTTVAPN